MQVGRQGHHSTRQLQADWFSFLCWYLVHQRKELHKITMTSTNHDPIISGLQHKLCQPLPTLMPFGVGCDVTMLFAGW